MSRLNGKKQDYPGIKAVYNSQAGYNTSDTLSDLSRLKLNSKDMELKTIPIPHREGLNLILGQSHFIKTVEDLHEAIFNAVPGAKFGLAFCEASDACLIRHSGTDPELVQLAQDSAVVIGAGHSFIVLLRDIYPINVLGAICAVPEVCHIFCATANPVEVIVAQTEQGRGILGVVDGFLPKGVESEADIAKRKAFLRQIGYKA
ncbi:hypothetical protein AYL99_02952 [Fonsecaea erecta]|uniref:Adenosine monophosphate-protein transferase n=1 Tax=Fonsecaea erecta TaxID=1367422 RepID=A0A178ZXK4_9EURO|nr:hypothetical protein AYL99_02952 [Fonsecaea erecta]OAP63725.1 hypothetical protein AYL99_02952 [Fonsecaea erecta]